MPAAHSEPNPPVHPEVMEFLLTRRSRPARMLVDPGPDRATLARLLTAAARVPDHGKLEPWRFVVIEGAARARLAQLARDRGLALGRDPEKLAKTIAAFAETPVTVAVITVPRPTDSIPEWEQILSAGGVCLGLVNAALAQGFGACWLSGFCAYDPVFLADGLGLAPDERVAGYIHVGTCAPQPPDRPRPDLDQVATWVSE